MFCNIQNFDARSTAVHTVEKLTASILCAWSVIRRFSRELCVDARPSVVQSARQRICAIMEVLEYKVTQCTSVQLYLLFRTFGAFDSGSSNCSKLSDHRRKSPRLPAESSCRRAQKDSVDQDFPRENLH